MYSLLARNDLLGQATAPERRGPTHHSTGLREKPRSPVISNVILRKTRIIQAMQYPAAFTLSSVSPLGFLPCAGIRLGALRWFQAFLFASSCAASATRYHFVSIAPPRWHSAFSRFAPVVNSVVSVFASGSNCAVKPTRLRRAAYFRRYICIMLFDFWKEMPPGAYVHPEDAPMLHEHREAFQLGMPPGHINGPLKTAPVVACYLNPGYEEDDAVLSQSHADKQILFEQIAGDAPFPLQFDGWTKWYKSRVGRVELPLNQLAETVSIFNVCAYASKNTKNISSKLLKSLPSSVVARRYLHEVLIPQAKRGERFVVIGRAAWAWEVDRSMECDTIRFAPNPAGGHFGPAIGGDISSWLSVRKTKVTR